MGSQNITRRKQQRQNNGSQTNHTNMENSIHENKNENCDNMGKQHYKSNVEMQQMSVLKGLINIMVRVWPSTGACRRSNKSKNW
jgi:hypothetical protein